jgi:hypothetical protein
VSLTTLVDRVRLIREANSFKSACRAFEKAIEPFGACYYALGPLAPRSGEGVFAVAEAPDNFTEHYLAEGLYENDPLRRGAALGRPL